MNERDARMSGHGPPAVLRLLVVADTAVQRAGLSALLSPLSSASPVLARSYDALRDIGHATGDAQREQAASLAGGVDAIVIVLDEAALMIGETAVHDGIAALAALGVPVLLLVADADHRTDLVAEWLALSVRAVLPLDVPASELETGLRAAVAGLTVLEPRTASAIARGGLRIAGGPRRTALAGTRAPSLTVREREVLALLAAGHATKTIARELGISAHTVKAHVESIFAKLGATTRAEAVAIGVRQGAVLL